MKKYFPLVKQIIFFGVVGVASLGIDVGVSTFLYAVCHFPAYLASAIGFLSGFAFNFPMNRKRVFHHTVHDKFTLKTQIIFYWLLSIFNLIVTSATVELLVEWGTTIQIAKVAVTIMIAVWNFLLFKFLIFSKHNT